LRRGTDHADELAVAAAARLRIPLLRALRMGAPHGARHASGMALATRRHPLGAVLHTLRLLEGGLLGRARPDAAHAVVEGRTSTGELAQFVFYAALVAGSMGALSEVFGDLQRAAGAAERLGELLPGSPQMHPLPLSATVSRQAPQAMPQSLEASGDAQAQQQAQHQPLPRVVAALQAVHFAYPSSPKHAVLRGVDLEVHAGETVALVGPSGAGKSTVIQLLLGLYACDTGKVRLGDDDAHADAQRCRARMAWVPQEPVLFSGTAFDNIRYGLLSASEAQVYAAARMAHADSFIRALPQGYQSELGERGIRLSGGQRQRLALARAILRNPDLLLLDEATSALDAESEALVQDTLDHWLPGRSSLVIAHRLATVRKAHRILVLDQGRVVESGDHASLLAQDGLYARLARLQFQA
ncbi:MAG: ATP-binding cassette domain-containing protein, partial [Betaproteobacteria bacterium]|nr:ATP-binding cassette domain-containing protein [Betaproteobacteria bacterium]